MKKIIGILVSVSMVFSVGMPVFAAPEADTPADSPEEMEAFVKEEDVASAETESPTAYAADAGNVTVEYHENLSLALSYDDRYDLSELEGISSDTEYTIYKTEYAQGQGITSCQVSQGKNTGVADEALLTFKEASNTEVIATGVGSGTVWLVRADQEEDLRKALEENPNGENPVETIDVYEIAVTVEPAPLTLMFLAGQSNMEGYCDSYTGYTTGKSIACEEGSVYSTYVPWSTSKGKEITGINFSEVCSTSNYRTTAGDFVAGSLQGSVTKGGVNTPSNMSGSTLEYPLNSLTAAGGGKTGPDSGLAYEWNQLTEDKVWVINTAYGATDIAQWVPGGSCYDRSVPVWEKVLQTYNAELSAGHYTAGNRLVFWQQGETGDATELTADEYESYFDTMYNAMTKELAMDAFGFFMVRAGHATNGGSDYRNEKDLQMSAPRIAQYWLGSGNSPYDTVYVTTNANEQWVSDSGVKTYFKNRYGSALSYPTQNGNESVPTTVNEVHYDIHYSQIGHNENGITAADGMLGALNNASVESISWRNGDGQTISSLTLELSTDTAIAVPVANPVYAAKKMSVTSASGNVIVYDIATGIVGAKSLSSSGTENLVASAGSKTGTLPVTISISNDLSKITGADYTGLYKYAGIWWYLKNGIIQPDYEGVVKNENGWWYVKDGQVDFTYNGFAQNSNGKWYIESGKVTFSKNGVLKDTTGAIGTKGTWYYVVGSKVQTSFTGLADYKNSNGWWYIKNGTVDFSANTIAKNKNGWWYIESGKVDFSYNGFGSNSNGKWYCEGGKVTFNQNSVLKDTTGAIGTKGTWYYVVGSKVQTSFTGLADYKNSNGWWYIKDGKVDFGANTVAKNKNGWWYVTGGKVRFGFTGLANYRNENGWWYIKDGKVDFTHSGVDKNVNGWWYMEGGKVIFSFNGIAQNSNGWWYIQGGKVDFSYSGTVTVSGIRYSVTDGKVAR